jgi:RNA-binding protein
VPQRESDKRKILFGKLSANGETASVITPLTSAEKRELKAKAQHLEPMVKLGHAGMSDAFLQSFDEALKLHALVKMKFTDFKEQKHELAPQIAEKTGSELVMQVGNVAVFYRPKPPKE